MGHRLLCTQPNRETLKQNQNSSQEDSFAQIWRCLQGFLPIAHRMLHGFQQVAGCRNHCVLISTLTLSLHTRGRHLRCSADTKQGGNWTYDGSLSSSLASQRELATSTSTTWQIARQRQHTDSWTSILEQQSISTYLCA